MKSVYILLKPVFLSGSINIRIVTAESEPLWCCKNKVCSDMFNDEWKQCFFQEAFQRADMNESNNLHALIKGCRWWWKRLGNNIKKKMLLRDDYESRRWPFISASAWAHYGVSVKNNDCLPVWWALFKWTSFVMTYINCLSLSVLGITPLFMPRSQYRLLQNITLVLVLKSCLFYLVSAINRGGLKVQFKPVFSTTTTMVAMEGHCLTCVHSGSNCKNRNRK